jgi:hypothetical protein
MHQPEGDDAEPYVSPYPPGVVRIIEDGDYETKARRRAPGVKAARELWGKIQDGLADYAATLKWR